MTKEHREVAFKLITGIAVLILLPFAGFLGGKVWDNETRIAVVETRVKLLQKVTEAQTKTLAAIQAEVSDHIKRRSEHEDQEVKTNRIKVVVQELLNQIVLVFESRLADQRREFELHISRFEAKLDKLMKVNGAED